MGKKKTSSTKRFVTVGEKAYSFYDAATGINVVRGDKVELSTRQLSSVKIKKALATGHLVYVTNEEKPVDLYSEEVIEKLKAQFEGMVAEGATPEKISKAFNLEEISKVAGEYGISVDDGDTVLDVVKALISDLEEENNVNQ